MGEQPQQLPKEPDMLAIALIKRVTQMSEAAHEQIADALDNVSSLAGNAAGSSLIAKALENLANAEGLYDFYMTFLSVAERMPEHQPADWFMHAVMRFNGVDDTWSGRGNDVKRSKIDGVRSAQQIVFGMITR